MIQDWLWLQMNISACKKLKSLLYEFYDGLPKLKQIIPSIIIQIMQHSIASIDPFNLVIPLFFICTLNTNSSQRVQEARVPATLCVLRAVLAFSFYLSLSRINEIFKYGSPNLN